MHKPHQDEPARAPTQILPSVTLIQQVTVQDQTALITPAPSRPELVRRDPLPQDPNNGNNECDQSVQAASRSASDAARQASQSASQSIQQAQQQASQAQQQASQAVSQAARQASQSASQGIQQAQQQASQSIADALRTASQAMSSASSALASAQSSAAQDMSRMQGSMQSVQSSASSAQSHASVAVLQAGAAVAAATGSAAAAGSSFLAAASAAAKATQSAAASVSAVGAAAASTISDANKQVSASQSAAVTATQAALAIVGSIIASALITILIYFLIIRHQKRAKRKKKESKSMSPDSDYASDPKFPVSDQVGTTIAGSQSAYNGTRDMPSTRDAPKNDSDISLSQFPATPSNPPSGNNAVKSTSVVWNPSDPPRAPKLGSWLKVQDVVSPFGSIKLPTETQSKSPLGGQLKSPLQSKYKTNNQSSYRTPSQYEAPPSSVYQGSDYPGRESKQSIFEIGKATVQQAMVRSVTISKPQSQRRPIPAPVPEPSPVKRTPIMSTSETLYSVNQIPAYRESKASVWTDEVPNSNASPYLSSPPGRKKVTSTSDRRYMEIPEPKNPVRTTAEWLDSIRDAADPPPTSRSRSGSIGARRMDSMSRSSGLPRSSKSIGVGMGGPRSTIGLPRGMKKEERDEQVRSVNGEIEYVKGLNQFFPQGNGLERMGSDSTTRGSSPGDSGGSSKGRSGKGDNGKGATSPGFGRAM